MSSARHRSTRDRPAKPPLGEDVVVDAALTILTARGLEAVTMRQVAAALDTGPASLYVYVDNRDGLLAAMLDRVVASVELEPPDPARWRTQLHALLARLRRALAAHPGIAAVPLVDSPTTDALLRLTENMLGVLLSGGIEPQDAAWTTDILVSLVTAAARENDVRRASAGDVGRLRTTLSDLPRDRFPLLVEHAARMTAGDSDARFRFAVDAVVAGVLTGGARP